MRLTLLIAALGLASAGPALACQWTYMPEEVGDSSARYLARKMVAAAATVDLVLVEDDGTRPMGQVATGVLTLRTIARLKGGSADRFTIFGSGLTLREDAERVFNAPIEHFTSEQGQIEPHPYNREYQGRLFPLQLAPGMPPPPPEPPSTCGPSGVAAQTGRFYVVMRGGDGRLLGQVPLDGERTHWAFSFVPVRLDGTDHWLRNVVGAAADRSSGARLDTRNPLLHLREGADPARVEAALRRAGLVPVAAYVRTGERIDEVRPADGEVGAAWLTRAIPHVASRGRGGVGDPHHGAAEWLRGKLGPARTYGGLGYQVAQAFVASIRRNQQVPTAGSRLFAVEVKGSVGVLVAADFAAGVRPLGLASGGLPELPGETEAIRFAAQQAIERDIWLLKGGQWQPAGDLAMRRSAHHRGWIAVALSLAAFALASCSTSSEQQRAALVSGLLSPARAAVRADAVPSLADSMLPTPIHREGTVIALRKRHDGTPALTIAPPAPWRSRWEAGQDTRREYLSGDGVRMTVETWAYEPAWACHEPSCGLSGIIVDGVNGKLLRVSDPRSVHAFIPRRNDAARRGVSVWATCSGAESCQLAEQVIASISGL